MLQQVNDSGGVTELVVVPGDQLNEGWGQQDTGLLVEDGRVRRTQEVGRDNSVLGVAQDTLQLTLGSLLDGLRDLLVRGWGLQSDGQVNDGDVDGWDSQRHTGQLTVQLRDNLTDGLSSTGGRWDDVTGSGSTTSPVLVGWTVNGLLGSGDGVDSGHQTLLNTEDVVNNLGQWSQTVGGTRGVGDNVLASVLGVVDTDNEHWGVSGRSSDDDLLGTTVNVLLGTLQGGEDTGGLNDVVDTSLTPWDLSWVSLAKDGDLLAVNDQLVVLRGDLTGVLTVGGVVLEHVSSVLWSNERVVDSNNLDVASGESNSQDETTDSAETVNTDSDSHC